MAGSPLAQLTRNRMLCTMYPAWFLPPVPSPYLCCAPRFAPDIVGGSEVALIGSPLHCTGKLSLFLSLARALGVEGLRKLRRLKQLRPAA